MERDFPPFPDVTVEERPGLDLYLIYPLTRLGVYPDRVRVQLLMPEGPGRTTSRRLNLVTPEIAAQTEYVKQKYAEISAASRKSNPEDQDINARQQMAARSRLARGGRLSRLEATVWHLAEYVRGRIRKEMLESG